MPSVARKMSEDVSDEAGAVFEAVASPVRLRMLKTLESSSSKYNELMRQIGLDQFKDAGRFAYHLRKLLRNGLVDVNSNTKKYRLTELGSRVLDYYRSVGDFISKKTRTLQVRKSNLVMEPFDRTKIENFLIREASLRPDLSAQIATEVEERLLSIPVRYLTAPLIREFVNAVLIEKGLEEYRHKLTRLGLPVYDVTSYFEKSGQVSEDVRKQAGDRVLVEYLLLNALPRDVADGHLSGMIHLNHAADWCLRPEDIVHDATLLLRGKKVPSGWGVAPMAVEFSGGMKNALALLGLGLERAAVEVGCGQTLDCFNFVLAKWAANSDEDTLGGATQDFLFDLVSCGRPVGLMIDLGEPPLSDLRGFREKASSIAELLISQLLSLSKSSLLSNLKLIVRVSDPNAFTEDSPLLLAHKLAMEQGNVVFTRNPDDGGAAAYTRNYARISSSKSGSYAADVSRSGVVGSVAVNLPRIAHVASGNERRLFEALDKTLRLAIKALGVRRDWVTNNMARGLLPVLSHHTPAESYFNHSKGAYLVELVGIEEAGRVFLGEDAPTEGALSITRKILEHVPAQLSHRTQRLSLRLAPSAGRHVGAAARMASIDSERYGPGEFPAHRDKPYSTFQVTSPSLSLEPRLSLEAEFQKRLNGGHALVIARDALTKSDSEDAFHLTEAAFKRFGLQSITYQTRRSMCLYCGIVLESDVALCKKCGSTTRVFTPAVE